jgi:hypothetical protein
MAIEVGLGSIGLIGPEKSKTIRIKNTARLEILEVSEAFASELEQRDDLDILDGPQAMRFDAEDNLI